LVLCFRPQDPYPHGVVAEHCRSTHYLVRITRKTRTQPLTTSVDQPPPPQSTAMQPQWLPAILSVAMKHFPSSAAISVPAPPTLQAPPSSSDTLPVLGTPPPPSTQPLQRKGQYTVQFVGRINHMFRFRGLPFQLQVVDPTYPDWSQRWSTSSIFPRSVYCAPTAS